MKEPIRIAVDLLHIRELSAVHSEETNNNNNASAEDCQAEEVLGSSSDGEEESASGLCERSMFTIREEESYEYESQMDSRCKSMQQESHIEELSTIKAEKANDNLHPTNCHTQQAACCASDEYLSSE